MFTTFDRQLELGRELSRIRGVTFERWAPRRPQHVLVTGTTGGFGLTVLRALLDTTSVTVHCLIRAASPAEAMTRLRANCIEHGFTWAPSWDDRTELVIGDLYRPRLGLDATTYDALAARLDAIVHCAANTSFIRPYQVSRRANVAGLLRVAELAAAERTSVLHFISSCSARVPEDYPSGHADIGMFNGYAQSKYVSERMVMDLAARGFPTAIYGIGYLAFDVAPFDARDAFESLLQLFIRQKRFPLFDCDFDYTPARAAARRVAATVMAPTLPKHKLELHHPQPLRWMDIAADVAAFDPSVALVPLDEHLPRYRTFMERFRGRTVYAMKSVFSEHFPRQMNLLFRGVQSAFADDELPTYDRRRFFGVLDLLRGGYEWI